MPTDTSVHRWKDIWQKLLDRLPLSDDPIEPEISAEVFVHNEPSRNTKIKAPTQAPATDRPGSR